jgi:hypothetical protein
MIVIRRIPRYCGYLLFTVVSTLALIAGCRKAADEKPASSGAVLQGSYVGIAQISGNNQNVLLTVAGPDSAGTIVGAIHHSGGAWTLATATLDSSGDTLRFTYQPAEISPNTYAARAVIGATGLSIHYVSPPTIPDFVVNREVNGTNMSGLWNGMVYSRSLINWRSATMDMDQSGQLYGGSVDFSLGQNVHCNITTGVTSGGSFQISGTARRGQIDYPIVFNGHYATLDSLVGDWLMGTNGTEDEGSFAFRRSY